jgi:hypothetical protein
MGRKHRAEESNQMWIMGVLVNAGRAVYILQITLFGT